MTLTDALKFLALLLLAAFAVGLSRGEVERWREAWLRRWAERKAGEWARKQVTR